jgi:hypothetical protein
MKIEKIKAHLVKTDKDDLSLAIIGPYWRIETNTGYIAWLTCPNYDDIREIPHSVLRRELELEFSDIYNVMHEQLELFK